MNIKTNENVELNVEVTYVEYYNSDDGRIAGRIVTKEMRVKDIMVNPGFFRYLHTDGTIEDIPLEDIKHQRITKSAIQSASVS